MSSLSEIREAVESLREVVLKERAEIEAVLSGLRLQILALGDLRIEDGVVENERSAIIAELKEIESTIQAIVETPVPEVVDSEPVEPETPASEPIEPDPQP